MLKTDVLSRNNKWAIEVLKLPITLTEVSSTCEALMGLFSQIYLILGIEI